MNINQFTNRVAKYLSAGLKKKFNTEVLVKINESNSHCASNSNYIDVRIGEDGSDGFECKISDHFNKGNCDLNYDITGSKLNIKEAKELAESWISRVIYNEKFGSYEVR